MHRATLLGRNYSDRHLDPPKVRFRRAITLALMSAFVPGSAQVALAGRWIRRLILLAWFAIAIAIGYVGYLAFEDRIAFVSNLVDVSLLRWLQIGILAAALIWITLLLHAWRLGRPGTLRAAHKGIVTVLNLSLIAGALSATAFAVYTIEAPRSAVTNVFTATEVSEPIEGRYNILLLGSDSGPGRDGMRPDSITLASIDANSGDTILFSLPRNLERIPFPEDSPMHAQFPLGFNCGSACMLNAVYTYGEGRPDLYPLTSTPGIDATIDAVRGATGLDVNYYIIINMEGFEKLVDAVGGLEINVLEPLPIGGVNEPIRDWINPGRQTLTGDEILWYTRARRHSDDFDRMGRQKCVMYAMSRQLNPQTVLFNAQDIADSSSDMLVTNIPASELNKFVELGLRSGDATISTVSFVPPEVFPGNPNFEAIHGKVLDALGMPLFGPSSEPRTVETDDVVDDEEDDEPFIGPVVQTGPRLPSGYAANTSDDLSATC